MTRYLRTEMVPLDQLTPFPGNARRGRVDVIRQSLRKNGQYRSLVVREVKNGPLVVLAGNHTMMAVEEEGGAQARCEIYECDDATARRINLVDNRSNDLAEDDEEALVALLEAVGDDHEGTGYTSEEISALIGDLESAVTAMDTIPGDIGQDEPVPEAPEEIATRSGDVWTLGEHRLMCGDCREPGDVLTLLDGSPVNLAFTSPPYASQREYDTESEFRPIPPDKYVEWFEPVAANVKDHLAPDGSWFVNIKASADGLDTYLYVHDLVLAHARDWGWHYATELCWRRIGVPKNVTRRFKNQFESIYQFTIGDWKMRPDAVRHESDSVPVAGGPGVGNTSWANSQGGNGAMFGGQGSEDDRGALPGLAYPGNMLPTFSGDHKATGHTAAFPVGLPQFFVLAYTDPGDAVYDPFSGSGSTILACERAGRRGFGMEVSAKYCDVSARRYQEVTGTVPLLNGEPYDFTT